MQCKQRRILSYFWVLHSLWCRVAQGHGSEGFAVNYYINRLLPLQISLSIIYSTLALAMLRILCWTAAITFLLILFHAVPAILIVHGISPYTGITIPCLSNHYRCNEGSKTDAGTVLSLVLGVLWLLLLWGHCCRIIIQGIRGGRSTYPTPFPEYLGRL